MFLLKKKKLNHSRWYTGCCR